MPAPYPAAQENCALLTQVAGRLHPRSDQENIRVQTPLVHFRRVYAGPELLRTPWKMPGPACGATPSHAGHHPEPRVSGAGFPNFKAARRILKKLRSNRTEQTLVRRLTRASRPAWRDRVGATEQVLGAEVVGNDGPIRGLGARRSDGGGHASSGWRLMEIVREIPGLDCGAAAQGIGRRNRKTAEKAASHCALSAAIQRPNSWVAPKSRETWVCRVARRFSRFTVPLRQTCEDGFCLIQRLAQMSHILPLLGMPVAFRTIS